MFKNRQPARLTKWSANVRAGRGQRMDKVPKDEPIERGPARREEGRAKMEERRQAWLTAPTPLARLIYVRVGGGQRSASPSAIDVDNPPARRTFTRGSEDEQSQSRAGIALVVVVLRPCRCAIEYSRTFSLCRASDRHCRSRRAERIPTAQTKLPTCTIKHCHTRARRPKHRTRTSISWRP